MSGLLDPRFSYRFGCRLKNFSKRFAALPETTTG